MAFPQMVYSAFIRYIAHHRVCSSTWNPVCGSSSPVCSRRRWRCLSDHRPHAELSLCHSFQATLEEKCFQYPEAAVCSHGFLFFWERRLMRNTEPSPLTRRDRRSPLAVPLYQRAADVHPEPSILSCQLHLQRDHYFVALGIKGHHSVDV